MRKVSPLGLTITKILAGLLAAETVLFAAGKMISRNQTVVSLPHEIGDWIVNPGDPPMSDFQRGRPRQVSAVYINGDEQPIHVDIAAVQSLDGLRQPQKYIVDSDGRISPYYTRVMEHRKRNAFSLSVLYGIDKNVINIHWCQKPGGPPVPMATDRFGDALRAILLRRPRLYVCDVWVDARPTSGAEATAQLQKITEAISEKIMAGG